MRPRYLLGVGVLGQTRPKYTFCSILTFLLCVTFL